MRVFALAQVVQGKEFRGYFYGESYLRTSSRDFTLVTLDNKFIHLTNDAIQKKSQDYGKYETGNKISQEDFTIWLQEHYNLDYYTVI